MSAYVLDRLYDYIFVTYVFNCYCNVCTCKLITTPQLQITRSYLQYE